MKKNTETTSDKSSSSSQKLKKKYKKLEEKYSKLEKKYLEKSRQANLFSAVEYITSKSFKLEHFLDRIMDWVLVTTSTVSAALLLLSDDGKTLEFVVAKGPRSEKLTGTTIRSDQGIAGKVLSSNTPHISQNVKEDTVWNPKIAKTIDYETFNLLAVPLNLRGDVIGVIEIINKTDFKEFTDEDVEFVQNLSSEVALALENARLLEKARLQANSFKTLSKLSAILNSSLDQKTVRKRAMESVIELLECETGSLYLIDEEKQELYFEVALGEKGEAVKEIRLKMGEGVAGWVAQEGKSDLVSDTRADSRWASRVDEKSRFQTLNMITVPVTTRKRTIGVLQAINKLHEKKPDKNDLRLLESLSNQVAIALENARLYEEQKTMFKETSEALATAIEKRDPYTGGHTKRVRNFSMATAQYLDLSQESLEWLEIAAILHDTGKIGVNDHILRKPGNLNEAEYEEMKKHPTYGYEILQHVKQLEPAIPGMKYHHERNDGLGYPDGLTAEEIPIIAKIISVADAWDAMTSNRPYRKGMPDSEARKEIQELRGLQFDDEIIDAFLKAYDDGKIISQSFE